MNKNDIEGDELLCKASQEGDLSKVIELINSGVNPNARELIYFESAIYLAAENGHIEIVKYLFLNGTNIRNGCNKKDLPDECNQRPNYCDTIKHEFEYYNNICATPLHASAKAGHFEIVKMLIEAGIPINIIDKFGDTPLHYAIKESLSYGSVGKKVVVAYLVRKGANLNIKNIKGFSPMDLITNNEILKADVLQQLKTFPNVLEYENFKHNIDEFHKFVEECSKRLGIKLVIKTQGFLKEWLGFFKKLNYWNNPLSGFRQGGLSFSAAKSFARSELSILILDDPILYPFYGGRLYFNYDKKQKVINIKLPFWNGFFNNNNTLVSGLIYTYVFLIVENEYRIRIFEYDGIDILRYAFGGEMHPDGDIRLLEFDDEIAPDAKRLADIRSDLCKRFNIPISIFSEFLI